MNLYIIRHGLPNYELDCLTEEGKKEAELLSISFDKVKFDLIFASSQGRAVETASYTCKRQNIEPIVEDWSREDIGAKYYSLPYDKNKGWNNVWNFWHPDYIKLLKSDEVLEYGNNWMDHPKLSKTTMPEGYKIMAESADKFLEKIGYHHDRNTRTYKKMEGIDYKNVAIFAHGAFALSFMSNILDIPYPLFVSTHDCMDCTGYSIIRFEGEECLPKISKYNETSHLEKVIYQKAEF